MVGVLKKLGDFPILMHKVLVAAFKLCNSIPVLAGSGEMRPRNIAMLVLFEALECC